MKLSINRVLRSLTAKILIIGISISIPSYEYAFATNYFIENKFARDLASTVPLEEIIWLDIGVPQKTLALLIKAEDTKKVGTAILLADINKHPNWPTIIAPLRKQLPIYGWDTLSIQMPIKSTSFLPSELQGLYDIAELRINAAINYLGDTDNKKIIIISHGLSAGIAIKYLVDNQKKRTDISALISISAYDTPWLSGSRLLREMPFAYLDIYAQNDSINVISSAKKRLASVRYSAEMIATPTSTRLSQKIQQLAKNKTGNPHYRQAVINGADKQFQQHQGSLLKTIRGWLKNRDLILPPGN